MDEGKKEGPQVGVISEVNNWNENEETTNRTDTNTSSEREKKPASQYPPGSLLNPYKLAIIGGGPAGCAIIVRAIRLGVIDELCSQSNITAGICMIEANELQKLGGGRLQDYRINSNTFGRKFVTNVTEDKPTLEPPENVTNTSLEKLRNSIIGQIIESKGNESAPLPQVGAFLHEVGEVVYEVIRSHNPSSKCLLETKVTKVQRHLEVWKLTLKSNMLTDEIEIYAKSVCFATGGKQIVPSTHFTANQSKKVVCSDEFCTKNGIYEARKKLLAKTQPKVVIVGGSHSAFSAAWICTQVLSKQEEEPTISMGGGIFKHQPGVRFGLAGICMMHRSYIRVFFANKKDADNDGYRDIGVVSKSTGQIHPFGGLRGDSKALWRQIKNNEEPRVRLVSMKNSTKSVDPCFATPISSISTKLYDDATIIIWACGYSSNIPPVIDQCGKSIEFVEVRGQLEVDETAHLRSKQLDISGIIRDPSALGAQQVPGLLGCGLGFGLKALLDNGEPDGSSGRADGVAVYLKRGATLVLAEVLGNKVFGEGNDTWEVRVASILKNARPSTAAPQTCIVVDPLESTIVGKITTSVSAPNSPVPNFMSPKKPVKDVASINEYKFRANPVPCTNKANSNIGKAKEANSNVGVSSSSSSSSSSMFPNRPKTSVVSSKVDSLKSSTHSNIATGATNANAVDDNDSHTTATPTPTTNVIKRLNNTVSTTSINRGIGSNGAGNRNRIRSIHAETLQRNRTHSENHTVAASTSVKLPSLKSTNIGNNASSLRGNGNQTVSSVSPTPVSSSPLVESSTNNSGQRRKSAPLIQEFQNQQQILEKQFPIKNNVVVLPTKTVSVGAIPQAATGRKGISGNSVNRPKSTLIATSGSKMGNVSKSFNIEHKEKCSASKFNILNTNGTATVVVETPLPAVIVPLLKSASAI